MYYLPKTESFHSNRTSKQHLLGANCRVGPCRQRSVHTPLCYRDGPSGSNTARCIKPSSDMHATEQEIKTIGRAYMTHRWQRQLRAKPGKEHDIFAGLSRMMLDHFADDHVLYLTDCGRSAAIVLTNQQQTSLINALQLMDFSIIPGTLQMLVAMPEDSIPTVKSELDDIFSSAKDIVKYMNHGGVYKQIMLIGTQPEVQGQGLATALLHAIDAEADTRHQMLLAEAPDEGNTGFYKRFGFNVVGRRELRPLMLRRVI